MSIFNNMDRRTLSSLNVFNAIRDNMLEIIISNLIILIPFFAANEPIIQYESYYLITNPALDLLIGTGAVLGYISIMALHSRLSRMLPKGKYYKDINYIEDSLLLPIAAFYVISIMALFLSDTGFKLLETQFLIGAIFMGIIGVIILLLSLGLMFNDLGRIFRNRILKVSSVILFVYGAGLFIPLIMITVDLRLHLYSSFSSLINMVVYSAAFVVSVALLMAYVGAGGIINTIIKQGILANFAVQSRYGVTKSNVNFSSYVSSPSISVSSLSGLDRLILERFRAGASLEQIAREAGVDVLEVQRRFIGLMDKGLVDLQLNQLELRILESARSGINVKEIAEQTGVSEETINWEINRLRAMTLLDDNLKLMPLGYHILIKTKKINNKLRNNAAYYYNYNRYWCCMDYFISNISQKVCKLIIT